MNRNQISFAEDTMGEVFTPEGDAAQVTFSRWDRGQMDVRVSTDRGVFWGADLEPSRGLKALPGYPA